MPPLESFLSKARLQEQHLFRAQQCEDQSKDKDDDKDTAEDKDMDEDEQKILEDYDTGRAKRAKEEASYATRLKPFRCQLGSTLS